MRAWPPQRVSTRFGKSCIPDPFLTLSPHLEALPKAMLDLVDSNCPSLPQYLTLDIFTLLVRGSS